MKNEKDIPEEVDFHEFTGEEPDFGADEKCEGGNEDTDRLSEESANPSAATDETDWKDKYMRLSAEFDNFRKRTLKEKMDLIAFGGEDVIVAVLPVLDDFERAIEAMDRSDNIESARQGMHLIHQKLVDTLQKKGVACIESTGADFDTDLHEAVTKFPSEDQKGKVIDTIQKGYKLKDKVIRFCKVVVGE
jgi:molecular chaperone GrpE